MTDEKTAPAAKKPAAKATPPQTAADRGYLGRKADPEPNSAHSLASGPDSPGPADVRRVNYDDLIEEV